MQGLFNTICLIIFIANNLAELQCFGNKIYLPLVTSSIIFFDIWIWILNFQQSRIASNVLNVIRIESNIDTVTRCFWARQIDQYLLFGDGCLMFIVILPNCRFLEAQSSRLCAGASGWWDNTCRLICHLNGVSAVFFVKLSIM